MLHIQRLSRGIVAHRAIGRQCWYVYDRRADLCPLPRRSRKRNRRFYFVPRGGNGFFQKTISGIAFVKSLFPNNHGSEPGIGWAGVKFKCFSLAVVSVDVDLITHVGVDFPAAVGGQFVISPCTRMIAGSHKSRMCWPILCSV